MARSNNYIFKRNDYGELLFQGDFEGYYQNHSDPWDQNSIDSDIYEYYQYSRAKLLKVIKGVESNQNILEIGCGLGLVTNMINQEFENSSVTGVDISNTAVCKAKIKYPNIEFYEGDIADVKFKSKKKYDVVIMNEMLWYILNNMDQAIENVCKILIDNGSLIISMAFLDNQQYGKDIINGYSGLLDYCKIRIASEFEVTFNDCDLSNKFNYSHGIVCLRKL